MSVSSVQTILAKVLHQFPKPELVKINDASSVEAKLVKMVKGGARSLQVVADFDRTISRYHINGKVCPSTAGVMRHSDEFSKKFREIGQSLYNQYYPIEIDLKIPDEEKIPLMVEWYTKSQENVIQNSGLLKTQLEDLVRKSPCLLRDNTAVFLERLHRASVPVLIFSAGVGNIIEILLEQNRMMYPNMRIVSNYYNFDKDTEEIVSSSRPIIHVLNKNECVLKLTDDTDKFDLEHRVNVILMGDHVGDASMCNGIPNPESVIRIGFLNEKVDENLQQYMLTFDIVLVDDQSMDFVNILLQYVLN